MDTATLGTVFETGMLACFGASWPVAVWKTYRSKNVSGKSALFIWLILAGYVSGSLFKILGRLDWVLALYIFNLVMVLTDLVLYYRYRGRTPGPETAPASGA